MEEHGAAIADASMFLSPLGAAHMLMNEPRQLKSTHPTLRHTIDVVFPTLLFYALRMLSNRSSLL